MANWTTLCSANYSGSGNYANMSVTIQYDADSITTTSVKLRSIGDPDWSTSDTYFIHDRAGNISRITYLGGSGSGSYTSNSFTITKDRFSSSFSIPEFWLCNDGQHRATSVYNDGNGHSHSEYFSSGRTGYKSVINSGGSTLTTTVYVTNVKTGTTTIVDNYNNTFKITATKGGDGAYNAAGGPADLKYGYASTSRNTTYTSGTAINLTLSGTGNTRTVYAESTTTATYGDNKKSTASLAIRQYKAPNAPGTPSLTAASYKNDRLTVKQNWTYSWTAATPGTGTGTTIGTGTNQTTSKVTGYRVLLFRKRPTENVFTSIPIKSGSTTLSTSSGGEHFYDISTNSLTINPIDCGIEAGDQVKLGVRPYTQYGVNNTGSKLIRSSTTESAADTVQNAGVMRVKPNNTVGWKEGVVWIKVNKGGTVQWVEADVVQVKTSAGWKESI